MFIKSKNGLRYYHDTYIYRVFIAIVSTIFPSVTPIGQKTILDALISARHELSAFKGRKNVRI